MCTAACRHTLSTGQQMAWHGAACGGEEWLRAVGTACFLGGFFGRRACRRAASPPLPPAAPVGVKIHVSIDQRCCLSSPLSVAHRFCLSSLLSSLLLLLLHGLPRTNRTPFFFIHPPCYFCVATCIMAPHPLLLPSTHLPICARTPPPYIPQPCSPSPTTTTSNPPPHTHLQSSSWRGLRWTT